jgi:hypothetical protein
MKTSFILLIFLSFCASSVAQNPSLLTDLPFVFENDKKIHFPESSYNYFSFSSGYLTYYGYYLVDRHSTIKTFVRHDSISVLIRFKEGISLASCNLHITRLLFNTQLNRMELVVGIKNGTRSLFYPITEVTPKVTSLGDNTYKISFHAKAGEEFSLFFGVLTGSTPTNKMYTVAALPESTKNIILLSSN